MKILALEQKSEDWLSWRQTGLGSSDIPVLVNGSHFGRTPLSLWQEKVGLIEREKGSSWAMQRGIDNEPVARQWFEKVIGYRALPVCCTHEEHSWMKASLDGLLIKDRTGEKILLDEEFLILSDWLQEPGNAGKAFILEIKVPNQNDHQEALDGQIPEKYKPQLLHQCLTTSTCCGYYVSFSLNSRRFAPEEQKTFVPFKASQQELDELLHIERTFWQHVSSRVPPN